MKWGMAYMSKDWISTGRFHPMENHDPWGFMNRSHDYGNFIGQSLPFWTGQLPRLQSLFPSLKKNKPDDFI